MAAKKEKANNLGIDRFFGFAIMKLLIPLRSLVFAGDRSFNLWRQRF